MYTYVVLIVLLLLVGCAKKPATAGYGAAMGDVAEEYDGEMSKSAPDAGRSYAPAPAPARSRSAGVAPAAPPPPPATQATAAEAPAAPAARMVHYQGFAELRVGRTDEAIDTVVAMVKTAGGGLEQQYGTTIVLRVPVAKFQEVYDAILKTGDVVRKTIAAEDITDAFTATELRLDTAMARRDRLVELLAKSKDEDEKLALVREIQQVTEEIDRLEAQVRSLEGLAAYSRITVQFSQRPALTWQGGAPESAVFAWIRQLTPFTQSLEGKRVAIPTPDGFVALDLKRRFVAESADGARIWTVRIENEPLGDATFWTDAVQRRLSSEFATAEAVTIGAWSGHRFVDRSDTPYVWLVLLRTDGKNLDLVEVYYPNPAAEARYAPAVQAALSGGGAS